MRNTFQTIARENFRSSGYITHPTDERGERWSYVSPPKSPFPTNDTVLAALQRGENPKLRHKPKPSILRICLNAIFRR